MLIYAGFLLCLINTSGPHQPNKIHILLSLLHTYQPLILSSLDLALKFPGFLQNSLDTPNEANKKASHHVHALSSHYQSVGNWQTLQFVINYSCRGHNVIIPAKTKC